MLERKYLCVFKISLINFTFLFEKYSLIYSFKEKGDKNDK